MLDLARLDTIYQYILAVAARSRRQLGPIHLLKYAYLADLAHAERKEGATYSGIDWRFHHFGPWSVEAFKEIAPAMEAVSAEQFRYPSKFGDEDVVRFALDYSIADELAARHENSLPLVIWNSITHAIAEHGSDTEDLLRYVYLTKPMLAAKPGDHLNFMLAARPQADRGHENAVSFTSGEKRRRAAIVESARAEIKRRLAVADSNRVAPWPPPRYDEVFYEGTAELDRLAGLAPTSSTGRIEVDDTVWDSPFRRDPEIP